MGMKILLIEDNLDNLEVMTCLLEPGHYQLLTAHDGQEGLDGALQNMPDLIVCDLQLSRLSGFEICKQLKDNPVLCRIPLVAVTALAMVGDRERILECGFDGYISKPINPRTFLQQIEAYLLSCSQGGGING